MKKFWNTISWRKVSTCVPRNFVAYNYRRTYTKGVFSWWAIFGDSTLEGILSFDIWAMKYSKKHYCQISLLRITLMLTLILGELFSCLMNWFLFFLFFFFFFFLREFQPIQSFNSIQKMNWFLWLHLLENNWRIVFIFGHCLHLVIGNLGLSYSLLDLLWELKNH